MAPGTANHDWKSTLSEILKRCVYLLKPWRAKGVFRKENQAGTEDDIDRDIQATSHAINSHGEGAVSEGS